MTPASVTEPAARRWLRRVGAAACAALLLVSWLMMLTYSGRGWYIEPTTEALARAVAATPGTVFWGRVQTAAAVGCAVMGRRRWMLLLALPGMTAVATVEAHPRADGSAFWFALLATLIIAPVGAWIAATDLGTRLLTRRAARQAAPAEPGG